MQFARFNELVDRGGQTMAVCNACRYCEQFCPVFPAMERRLTFDKGDLAYLANLCHNCGECLYACQYAPPHEFGINVPATLAELRLRFYEQYCWPRPLGAAFRRQGISTAIVLAIGFSAALLLATLTSRPEALWSRDRSADFYAVVPHGMMVALFGGVFAFAILAIGIGLSRFWREVTSSFPASTRRAMEKRRASPVEPTLIALRDALTLEHLKTGTVDCVSAEEVRTPWRRWCHHFTAYGFLLCFASTTIAAIYHTVFGWVAPYGYSSLPVMLGTLGGGGLLLGACGLFALRSERDSALGGEFMEGIDESFIALLVLTAVTGLALLFLRHQPIMGLLLIVHLGIVLALFVTLPYGKFVHGLYRLAALMIDAREDAAPSR